MDLNTSWIFVAYFKEAWRQLCVKPTSNLDTVGQHIGSSALGPYIPFPSIFGESETQFGKNGNEFGQYAIRFGETETEFSQSANKFGQSENELGQSANEFGHNAIELGEIANEFVRGESHFGQSEIQFGKIYIK